LLALSAPIRLSVYSATSPDSLVMFMFQRPNIFSICCASGDGYHADPSWRRSSGRPRTTWLDQISVDTGMSLKYTFSLAQDRSQWTAVATTANATRTWVGDWSYWPWL